MEGSERWTARLADWWAQFPLEDAVRLGPGMLIVLGFMGGLGYLGWIAINPQEPDCLETFFLSNPILVAALLASRLEEMGLVDPEGATIEGWGWRYGSGEVRIVLRLDTGLYSAVPCFLPQGGFSLLDVMTERR